MGEVIRFKRRRLSETAQGKTLCRSGFHKWLICKEKKFDVKQGRLVTVQRCARCGVTRTQAL